MRLALALAATLLLAACSGGGTSGAPDSGTGRLNGQAGFYAGIGGMTR
jgi:hypothetical protein